jgi:DNA-binding NtrC family response regulator
VVDDDNLLRKLVTEQLSRSDFDATPAGSARAALEVLRESDIDVVLLDIMMPDMTGLEALAKFASSKILRKLYADGRHLSLNRHRGHATWAYDYLTKPATLDEMEAVLRKADEKRRLLKQNASLRAVAQPPGTGDGPIPVIHKDSRMSAVVSQAEAAARSDSTVLLTGESGTGKDVLARFIHSKSGRSSNPMIMVNCGALPETLFESEFFGHERGAFTEPVPYGEACSRPLMVQVLFLDEIGDLPLVMQVKLLHFLEQGRFRRVGSTRDQNADVRIIAATNRELASEVERQRFRADLYYRLNVVSLHVPPLRERAEDIPRFIDHLSGNLPATVQPAPTWICPTEARQGLQSYSWPGNVRELRNCLWSELRRFLSATRSKQVKFPFSRSDRSAWQQGTPHTHRPVAPHTLPR